MAIWVFDLDDTISAVPGLMKTLMDGLRANGDEVHIVSGVRGRDVATQGDVQEKKDQLDSLGCADCYDYLVAVSGPEKKIPEQKVNYMRHGGATALIDNSKANIKAARKAGFVGLHFGKPK
jgi:hypothetical protein